MKKREKEEARRKLLEKRLSQIDCSGCPLRLGDISGLWGNPKVLCEAHLAIGERGLVYAPRSREDGKPTCWLKWQCVTAQSTLHLTRDIIAAGESVISGWEEFIQKWAETYRPLFFPEGVTT